MGVNASIVYSNIHKYGNTTAASIPIALTEALEEGNWQAIQTSPEWLSWQGYAFEGICYKHLGQIRRALLLQPTALPNTWRYVPKKGSSDRGAQIDLLFDRKDGVITICEIKCTEKPYIISKDALELLNRRLSVFRQKTGTQKQLFLSFISMSGLKMNDYAKDNIDGVVELNDLFAE